MAGLLRSFVQFLYPLRKRLIRLTSTRNVSSGKITMTTGTKTIFDFKIEGIDGKEIDFEKFRGKKMLLVNTASECGYTPQYAPLQKLYEQFHEKLEVIGFPSNDFDAQEPGDEKEILNFCQRNYGVTFPLTKKIDVIGPNKNEIFQWLTRKDLNGWNDRDPNWNFCKYLVDENGHLVKFFSHKMDPLDSAIVSRITDT